MDVTVLINSVLFTFLLAMAAVVILRRNLVSAAIFLCIYSLCSAGLFLTLKAPDVAMTEASIGAAISLMFFLASFRVVGQKETEPRKYIYPAATGCVALFLLLVVAIGSMPEFGDKDSPANSYLGKYYLENTMADIDAPNTVTAVLASYRGFDTLGETYVILCAGLAVLLILPRFKKRVRA